MGLNRLKEKLPRITSRANSAPAIGVLNVAAMPAAAPQPTKVRMRCMFTLVNCPKVDPRAAPIWAMGPSRPTERPLPILMAVAMEVSTATRGFMRPPRSATASMMSGSPRASRVLK